MEWINRRRFGWFAVVVSIPLIALALLNLAVNTTRVTSWLPLLVIMSLVMLYGIRCLRSPTAGSDQALLAWPEPRLAAGESVVVQTRANWSKSGIARGGTLVLTDRRLIFEPNSVEASIGLVSSQWPVSTIIGIGVAPRGWNLFAGASRRRLEVRFEDGDSALFVVREVDELADRLASQLA